MEKNKKLCILVLILIILGIIIFAYINNIDSNTISDYQNTSETNLSELNTTVPEIKEIDLEVEYNSIQVSYIQLSDNGITTENSNAVVNDNIVKIKSPGEYYITGTLSDGYILVDSDSTSDIHLFLDNVSITSKNYSPIMIEQADKVVITLVDNTTNTLTDGTTYINLVDEEPDGALFSKDDLTINGNGKLIVNANYMDGIVCKDDLIIAGGDIMINSNGHGVRGTDSVTIAEGTLNIICKEDGIHSNGNIVVDKTDLVIIASDDGIHADIKLTINDGIINVNQSYEGLEATLVEINGGTIFLNANDDGINGAGGNTTQTSTSQNTDPFKKDSFQSSSGEIIINGGDISISAAKIGSGDSIDANGNITITGGTIKITSPTNARDYSSLDCDGSLNMTGGEVYIDNVKYTSNTIKNVQGSAGMPSGGKINEKNKKF